MIKAYLIDPFAKRVTEVERPSDGRGIAALHEIYDLLHCDSIASVNPEGVGSDVIYVDDEGLFKNEQAFFKCRLWHEMLAGRGLWVGATRDGDDASPTTALNFVRASILFEL